MLALLLFAPLFLAFEVGQLVLCERYLGVKQIARGAAKAQVEDEGPRLRRDRDSLDIPRFLNRQNNQ